MSVGLIALFFALGLGGFTYVKFAHYTGNATPRSTFIAAGVVAFIVYIFFFTLLKYVLHF